MRTNKSQSIALYGMFIALAFIISYIEHMIPFNFGIPGIKPGLANIIVLSALYTIGCKAALSLTIVRVLLTGFTFGNIYQIMYGMAGALLSFIFMFILFKIKKFSIIGVSMAGGVTHNIGQIIVAIIVLKKTLIYYLPFLIIGGALSGTLVGILGFLLVPRIKKLIRNK